MAQRGPWLLTLVTQVCRRCHSHSQRTRAPDLFTRSFGTSQRRRADITITAAPEIDLTASDDTPARIIPASPSYFTSSPIFNDDLLHLQALLKKFEGLPTVAPDDAPLGIWMKLTQYRSSIGEQIAASKYSKVLSLLTRLNRIHPDVRPATIRQVLSRFRRPGASELQKATPGQIDEHGRSFGVGRRKESTAKVYLVEGTGEVIVNGKTIVQALPRLHDRESALWALKVSERTDKYNVFARVNGGGVTGQAESLTLAIAKALLVHEPALKPVLRRVGCITRDARKVERKKPGRRKARKRPAWVKR